MKKNWLKTIFVSIIVAAISVIVITVCIIFIPSRPCIGIEAIRDLKTVQINDTLLVTWLQPHGSGNCPMIYHIRLSKGGEVIEEGFAIQPKFQFSNVTFPPCSLGTIFVYAVSARRFGDEITGQNSTFTHFGNIGPVTNLQVLQENYNTLIASWDPPIDSGLCSLSYEVKFQALENESQEPNVTFDNAFTFKGVNLRPCATNVITITPIGQANAQSVLRGQEETRAHFGDVGSVEAFQIDRGDGGTILTSWSAPNNTEDCQLSYEITLTFQGELMAQPITQLHHQNFNIEDIRACSLSNVTITPIATVGYDEVRGLELHRIHIEGLGPVTNLEITRQSTGLLVGWDPPDDGDFCTDVSYEVVLQTRDGTVQETRIVLENQVLFEEDNLEACVTNVVTVTPMANINEGETAVKGEGVTRLYFGDVGPVVDLVIAQEGGDLVVSWSPPLVSEDCPMIYEVGMWYSEDDVITSQTDQLVHLFENVNLKPCVAYQVSVIPIVRKDAHESEGEEVRGRHFGEIGPATNLELTLNYDKQLVARWDAPVESDICELTYEILLETSDGVTTKGLIQSQLEHVFIDVNLRPCAINNVTLTPIAIFDGGHSMRGPQDFQTYFAGVGPVENLEIARSGDALLVSWMPPAVSELCQMSYHVILSFGDVILDQVLIDAEQHTFDEANLHACVESRVTVVSIGRNQGQEAEGPEISRGYFIELGPVTNLEVTQQTNGLFASWGAPKNTDFCIEISYEVVLRSSDDTLIENRVVLEGEVLFEEADLEPCATSVISVNPMAKVDDGGAIVGGEILTGLYIADIGGVEGLTVARVEETLVVNWGPPIVSASCPLTYEVKLLQNDQVVQIDNLEHTFEGVDLRPCLVSEVLVIPIAVVDLHERRGQEKSGQHIGEIGSVSDLELVLNDANQLTVRWGAPIASELCSLSYEILLKSSEDSTLQIFTTESLFEHVLDGVGLRPCVVYSVTLTPTAIVESEPIRGLGDFRTYVAELGPVTNLEVTQQSGALVVTWGPPDNNDFCFDMSYEVVLESADGNVLKSDVVLENAFSFEEVELEPCAISITTVTPAAKTNDGVTTVGGEALTSSHLTDIGPVEDLVIAQTEAGLVVNWVSPAVSESCPLAFEVSLWYEGDVAQVATIDDLAHVFEDADLRPCVFTEVSVVPIARKDSHESRGEETRGRHIGEIGPATNFELALDDLNQLTARWDTPIGSELCVLSYEILFESSEGGAPQTFTETHLEHVFIEADLRPCVLHTLSLTPIAVVEGETIRGLRDTRTHFTDVGPVKNLVVSQTGGALIVSWLYPVESEFCQMTYEVTLSFGEVVLSQVQTAAEEYTFVEVDLQSCVENRVKVISIGYNQGRETRGPEVNYLHIADVGPVRNLRFQTEPFGVSWNEPVNSDACVLSYHIQIEPNGENVVVTDKFHALEDVACLQYVVTVTPVVQEERRGPPEMESYELPPVTEIGPIQNLQFSENVFEWDPPINVGACEVTYDITMTVNGESTTHTTKERVFEVSSFCATVEVSITASVLDVSEPVGLEVEVPLLSLGPVENLEFRSNRVRWEKPLDSGLCPIEYRLTHISGSGTNEVTLPGSVTYLLINLKYCSHHEVSVYAFYEEKSIAGVPLTLETTISLPNDPHAIGRVEALKLASETRVEWQPPSSIDVESCPVIYSVTLDRGFDMITVSEEDTYFEIPSVPCSVNIVSVFPIVEGVLGQVNEITSEMAPLFLVDQAPELISYTTDSTSISTVWRTLGKEINACQITNFTVDLSSTTFVNPVSDNDERIISLEVVDLLPDTEYTMSTGIHILSFPISGPLSEPFTFRTDPNPQIEMKLKWYPPKRSVQGYQVVIRDSGPAHFLPRACLGYTPHESVRFLSGNTTEFQPSSYLPSHNYKITVTPLGASENYTFETVSPEARPGTLDLSVEIVRGEEDGPTAVISWPIPCDVNGKLLKFTVEGESWSGEKSRSFKGVVPAEEGRENYSFEIRRIPEGSFFAVYVRTHLQTLRGNETMITFNTFARP